jgi:hypothetical protein
MGLAIARVAHVALSAAAPAATDKDLQSMGRASAIVVPSESRLLSRDGDRASGSSPIRCPSALGVAPA